MPRYTDAQRRKGLATRRRKAWQRRKEIEKLGYNPYNPTVKLGNGVSVTRAVEERLWRKAQSTIPTGAAMIVIWVFVFLFISEFGFWLPLSAVILTVVLAYLNAEVVKKQTEQLAKDRKIRLDEMRRFYTSPEWLLIRKQVIREEGNICSRCGKYIWNKIDVTVDHKLPRSKYPNLALDRQNLRVLCRSCNSSKGDRDSEIFAVEALTEESPIEESEIQESSPTIREKTQSDVNELELKTIVARHDEPATKRDWILFGIAVLVITLGVWAVAVLGK